MLPLLLYFGQFLFEELLLVLKGELFFTLTLVLPLLLLDLDDELASLALESETTLHFLGFESLELIYG